MPLEFNTLIRTMKENIVNAVYEARYMIIIISTYNCKDTHGTIDCLLTLQCATLDYIDKIFSKSCISLFSYHIM